MKESSRNLSTASEGSWDVRTLLRLAPSGARPLYIFQKVPGVDFTFNYNPTYIPSIDCVSEDANRSFTGCGHELTHTWTSSLPSMLSFLFVLHERVVLDGE